MSLCPARRAGRPRSRRRRRDGHHAAGRRPHPRRLRRARGLQRDPQRHPARRGRGRPRGVLRGRRRLRRDQHVRRATWPTSASTTSRTGSASWPRRAPGWPARWPTSGPTPDRPRFVLGSIGPGTKLPTLGHAPYATLRDAYQEQRGGLLAGGADALIVETCQDLLQAKAAVIGATRAMAQAGRARAADLPRHRRDHRHDAARQRDRRRADRARAARHRPDRAQLRDRPGRDERAPALPVAARPRAAVGDAQRRPAAADRERRRLPADRRTSWPRRWTGSSPSTARVWSAAAAAPRPSTSGRSPKRSRRGRSRPSGTPVPRARVRPRCTTTCRSPRTPAC